MNDAILPPNQQEGLQLQMQTCKFVMRGGERYAKEVPSRAVKTHKYTSRQSGEKQSEWCELSSRVAKILAAQNKNFSDSGEKWTEAPCSLSPEAAPAK